MFIGNLTRDPELRQTQTGKAVCNFSIAVNEGSGDNKSTEYVNVVCWEKTAENVAKYLVKGRPVFVEARKQQREYEGKDGTKNRVDEYVAYTVTFLPHASDISSSTSTAGAIDF